METHEQAAARIEIQKAEAVAKQKAERAIIRRETATAVMQGIVANPGLRTGVSWNVIANTAIAAADALLAELEKPT